MKVDIKYYKVNFLVGDYEATIMWSEIARFLSCCPVASTFIMSLPLINDREETSVETNAVMRSKDITPKAMIVH